MIRHNQWSIQLAEVVDFTAKTAQWHSCTQQILCRDAPDGEHESGLQQLNLTQQIGQTRGDLLRLRVTVAGRPTLQHVGDVHVGSSVEADCTQHGIEKMSRATDERLTPPV